MDFNFKELYINMSYVKDLFISNFCRVLYTTSFYVPEDNKPLEWFNSHNSSYPIVTDILIKYCVHGGTNG